MPVLLEKGRMYIVHRIHKPNGGWRDIEEPVPELKVRQKEIVKLIASKVKFNKCVNGIARTNTITNADPHVGMPIVFKIDLKDYFHTVTRDKIAAAFLQHNIEVDINEVLYEERLPTGAPTSPIIANLVFHHIDNSILDIMGTLPINYTRYMDDLTFSGARLEVITPEFCLAIRQLILTNGFLINYKKSGIKLDFQQQKVTGIVVNKKRNIDKYTRNLMRAKLDYLAKNNYPLTEEIKGELSYFSSINPTLKDKFSTYYRKRLEVYNHQN